MGPEIRVPTVAISISRVITASVTPDRKYLFFSRNMSTDNYENVDIFWVDAQVIEMLRPKP